jgi:hypothetical protein
MPMDPKEIKRLAKKRYEAMMAAKGDEPEADDNPAEEAKELMGKPAHHGVSVTIAVGMPHHGQK